MVYYAHSGTPGDRGDWQKLSDHLEQTADLAAAAANPLSLSATARLLGSLHDFGKYDPAFDQRLTGGPERVDHSTAGGVLVIARADRATRAGAHMLAHAILGHHAGLPDSIRPPDSRGGGASLSERLEAFTDRIDPAISAATAIDLRPAITELRAKLRPGSAFDLSLALRMAFSCLVDADYKDTERYYAALENRERDRNWPNLGEKLPDLRAALDLRLAQFAPDSDLNRLRADILAHIRARATRPPGLYTLTVPTGGGKTLASMAFALDHAAAHGHRRIIYAIPYTAIIDQTAETFREMFGDLVLEHHSAIDVEKPDPSGRDKLRLAMEDWAAPIIVTTNVQLFESLFAARPSRTRKLHNIAGSVIILDEAQCLPRPLLLPTLRMIDALAVHFGCTIVLCTATQPAFDSAQLGPDGLNLADRELAPDPAALTHRLRRARIVQGGARTDGDLVAALRSTPQGMVIVNSRAHALALFDQVRAEGLEGALHLTTRQHPVDRRRIIADIRARLAQGYPCRLIATSLIEAGVDLDFPVGWRAEAGLDSIIQAAGRVNREGRRPVEDSTLTVFTAPDHPVAGEIRTLAEATRSVSRTIDLNVPEAITRWFDEVYWKAMVGTDSNGNKLLDKSGIVDSFVVAGTEVNFPYRTTAEKYRMVEDTMVPVIISTDDNARDIARLDVEAVSSGTIARALQPYVVSVPNQHREALRRNGRGDFIAPGLRGDQFFVLTDPTLYRPDSGLWWEGADQLGEGQGVV